MATKAQKRRRIIVGTILAAGLGLLGLFGVSALGFWQWRRNKEREETPLDESINLLGEASYLERSGTSTPQEMRRIANAITQRALHPSMTPAQKRVLLSKAQSMAARAGAFVGQTIAGAR